jgi:hypothetical protein
MWEECIDVMQSGPESGLLQLTKYVIHCTLQFR